MSWISEIDEEQADGMLQNVYKKIIEKRGKLSNIMRVQSLHPQALQAHMDLYLSVMYAQSPLSREYRELIAVVVSSLNKCSYCVHHHAEALRHYWKDAGRVRQVCEDFKKVDLSEKEAMMLEYVSLLTRTPDAVSQSHIQSLRKLGFSDRELLDIVLVVSYFNFVNRLVLGLGVHFSSDEVVGYTY